MLACLTRLLKRVVPRNRITELCQWMLHIAHRITLPDAEREYVLAAKRYTDVQEKLAKLVRFFCQIAARFSSFWKSVCGAGGGRGSEVEGVMWGR